MGPLKYSLVCVRDRDSLFVFRVTAFGAMIRPTRSSRSGQRLDFARAAHGHARSQAPDLPDRKSDRKKQNSTLLWQQFGPFGTRNLLAIGGLAVGINTGVTVNNLKCVCICVHFSPSQISLHLLNSSVWKPLFRW